MPRTVRRVADYPEPIRGGTYFSGLYLWRFTSASACISSNVYYTCNYVFFSQEAEHSRLKNLGPAPERPAEAAGAPAGASGGMPGLIVPGGGPRTNRAGIVELASAEFGEGGMEEMD